MDAARKVRLIYKDGGKRRLIEMNRVRDTFRNRNMTGEEWEFGLGQQ